MMMAMTHANTGRSRKNLDSIVVLPDQFADGCAASVSFGGLRGTAFTEVPGPHVQHPFDDHAVPRREAGRNEPGVADGAVERERPLLDLPGLIHDPRHGVPLRGPDDPLLGGQDGLLHHALLHDGAQEHPGQQQVARVRGHDAHGERPGRRLHGDVPKLQGAFLGIRRPVLEEQADLPAGFAVGAQAPALQVAPEAQQLGRRLGHVHVDGVELLDDGERGRLVGRDQRPVGDAGPADSAGDRCRDARVAEIDPGGLDRRLPVLDLRPRLLHAGGGVVVVLAADRIFRQQFPVPLGLQFERRQVGLRLGERRPGGLVGHLERSRIDLVQQLAGLHVRAFLEQALLDDPAHLRADFGNAVWRGAAGQLGR